MKRIIQRGLAVLLCVVTLTPASMAWAAPPDDPLIATKGLLPSIFEMDGSDGKGWRDLKTPPHFVRPSNEIVYCLDHKADNPMGIRYGKFDPAAYYSDNVQRGVVAILENGYPMNNHGFTGDEARYVTANALRCWLIESAGIGYNFMLLDNGKIRPKAGYEAQWAWLNELVADARAGKGVAHSVSADPLRLTLSDGRLTGTTKVKGTNLNGGYKLNQDAIPSGVSITGYTGVVGDTLTVTAPMSYLGREINLANVLVGYDNRSPAGVFWYRSNNSTLQPVIAPVFEAHGPVVSGTIKASSVVGELRIEKHQKQSGDLLDGARFAVKWNGKLMGITLIDPGEYSYSTYGEPMEIETHNGVATITGIPEGEIEVIETVPPLGHLLDDTTKRTAQINTNGQLVTIKYSNPQIMGQARIHKMGEQQDPLPGVVYGIYAADGTRIEGITTGPDGYATTSMLPYCTPDHAYYFQEEMAAEGYNLNPDPIPFVISEQDCLVELEASNTIIRGRARIRKTGEQQDPLPGVVYGVHAADGTRIEGITTGPDGYATTSMLPYCTPDHAYYFQEEMAAEGYNLNPDPIPFVIDSQDCMIELEASNTIIRGQARIRKTDALTGEHLAGAVYGLYRAADDAWVEDVTTVADEQGALTSSLVYGQYYFMEKVPPTGYLPNRTKYPFEIKDQDAIIDIVAQDERIVGSVQVYYRHVRHGHELHPAYAYTDWVGIDYHPWLQADGKDQMPLEGYEFVRADYPAEPVLIDGLLTVTYWYDDPVNGHWVDVDIPKTGPGLPVTLALAAVCLGCALCVGLYLRRRQRHG